MDANEGRILIALLITACIVAMILVFFIITILGYHKRNLLLYKEKLAIEIETQEKERKRIAGDLHDELGPILSTVKLQVSLLEGHTEEEHGIAEKIKKNVDAILASIRVISNDLVPNVLLRKGLYRAIESFADEINETGAMSVELMIDGNGAGISKQAEVHIYRIVQELVNNSLKHSKGETISIRVKETGSTLRILFSDDGPGYNEAVVQNNNSGSGLDSIRNRVELLKGKIKKDNSGRGALYLIELPLKDNHDKSSDSR